MSRETKATSKWIQDGRFVRSECDFEIIAECGVENGLDHARLIADALNVKDETGLTPRELVDRIKTLEQACQKQNESICQALGKALDYPRYCDDQANFPGATEADGVCTADHVAESLATAAAERIKVLEGERAELSKVSGRLLEALIETRCWIATGEGTPKTRGAKCEYQSTMMALGEVAIKIAEGLSVALAFNLIARLEGTQGK